MRGAHFDRLLGEYKSTVNTTPFGILILLSYLRHTPHRYLECTRRRLSTGALLPTTGNLPIHLMANLTMVVPWLLSL